MDPKRLKQAFAHLEDLDDRLSYKLRGGGGSMIRPSAEQLDSKMQDLAHYTLELKDVVRELIIAIASKPKPAE